MALITAKLAEKDFGMDIADNEGHTIRMDIPVAQGGKGTGFRPMQAVLASLCGCSAVDVISILSKQRQHLEHFVIEVDGEREKDKDLALWQQVDLVFKLEGDIEPAKAYRAVDLSVMKYCSVAETLRLAGASINFKVMLNGSEVNPN